VENATVELHGKPLFQRWTYSTTVEKHSVTTPPVYIVRRSIG